MSAMKDFVSYTKSRIEVASALKVWYTTVSKRLVYASSTLFSEILSIEDDENIGKVAFMIKLVDDMSSEDLFSSAPSFFNSMKPIIKRSIWRFSSVATDILALSPSDQEGKTSYDVFKARLLAADDDARGKMIFEIFDEGIAALAKLLIRLRNGINEKTISLKSRLFDRTKCFKGHERKYLITHVAYIREVVSATKFVGKSLESFLAIVDDLDPSDPLSDGIHQISDIVRDKTHLTDLLHSFSKINTISPDMVISALNTSSVTCSGMVDETRRVNSGVFSDSSDDDPCTDEDDGHDDMDPLDSEEDISGHKRTRDEANVDDSLLSSSSSQLPPPSKRHESDD